MMIAMVIIMVGLLGLVQAALLTIDNNMRNLLRDEAVRISEQALTGELIDTGGTKHEGLKNLPVSNDPYPQGLKDKLAVVHCGKKFRGRRDEAYTP